MKLISWNVNGIRATYKKGLTQFLAQENPDIFCVQETKAQLDQVGEEIRALLGPSSFWASAEKKGYSGVATFINSAAAKDFEGVDLKLGIEKYDREGRVVITHHKGFDLYNIYFPNGARGPDRHSYKMEFLKDLSAHLTSEIEKKREIILVGDYNIAPTPLDIYDPIKHAKTSGFLPEEREWYQHFLKLGFVDTFRYFFPDVKERYSWWNQIERARIHNRGWRIDMICITQGLLPKLTRADILDQIEGSDHCPVLIELKL